MSFSLSIKILNVHTLWLIRSISRNLSTYILIEVHKSIWKGVRCNTVYDSKKMETVEMSISTDCLSELLFTPIMRYYATIERMRYWYWKMSRLRKKNQVAEQGAWSKLICTLKRILTYKVNIHIFLTTHRLLLTCCTKSVKNAYLKRGDCSLDSMYEGDIFLLFTVYLLNIHNFYCKHLFFKILN